MLIIRQQCTNVGGCFIKHGTEMCRRSYVASCSTISVTFRMSNRTRCSHQQQNTKRETDTPEGHILAYISRAVTITTTHPMLRQE